MKLVMSRRLVDSTSLTFIPLEALSDMFPSPSDLKPPFLYHAVTILSPFYRP